VTAKEWAQKQIPERGLDQWVLDYMVGYAAQAMTDQPRDAKRFLDNDWAPPHEVADLMARLASVERELGEWRTGAHADHTGHMHRCLKVQAKWSCVKGCAVAERDALLAAIKDNQTEITRVATERDSLKSK
jgi:hypothetical protein